MDSDEEEWISLSALAQEIRDVYLSAKRPWIVAYSGGKDSTATLQLLWYALTALPPEHRLYPIYIVANDTLVEDPAMALRARSSCMRINESAAAEARDLAQRYPEYSQPIPPLFSARILKPELRQRFFFLLIGLGYPSPTTRTRWCVERLKLAPAQKCIEEMISTRGEVVITLGAREEESPARARSLRKHALPGQLLKRHSTLRGAWVYTPIEVWSTTDVWQYLLTIENPWGEQNQDLIALYRASSGECPLVVDTKVSSCAGGRSGCWVCTVCQRNRSMENRVDSGEEWLVPFLEFREFLMQTTDPAQKHLYRTLEGRANHLIQLNRQGKPSYRCYTLETRKELLRRLLLTQEQVRREGPDPRIELIDKEELCAIREVWLAEGDWEDSLPRIYHEVTGREENWPQREDERWKNAQTKQTLLYHCERQQLPPQLVIELLEAMLQFQRTARVSLSAEGSQKRSAELPALFEDDPVVVAQQEAMRQLLKNIGDLFSRRDWRTHDERLAEVMERHQAEQVQKPELTPWMSTERTKRV